MRSVFGDSNDDWTGVVEVQQAEVFATAAAAAGVTQLTEVKADKGRTMELLMRIVRSQLPQTVVRPEKDQRG
jgi:hypothetical protein